MAAMPVERKKQYDATLAALLDDRPAPVTAKSCGKHLARTRRG